MVKTRKVFTVALRILATAACFSAVFIMATSRETVTFFGITMEAKYQYTPSFKFLVGANAVVSAYSLLALYVPPNMSSLTRLIVILDVLVALLLTASISAAGAVSYVGKYGNSHSGWMPVCDKVPKYCNKTMGALVCNFAGAAIYLMIVLHDIHAAFNSDPI